MVQGCPRVGAGVRLLLLPICMLPHCGEFSYISSGGVHHVVSVSLVPVFASMPLVLGKVCCQLDVPEWRYREGYMHQTNETSMAKTHTSHAFQEKTPMLTPCHLSVSTCLIVLCREGMKVQYHRVSVRNGTKQRVVSFWFPFQTSPEGTHAYGGVPKEGKGPLESLLQPQLVAPAGPRLPL